MSDNLFDPREDMDALYESYKSYVDADARDPAAWARPVAPMMNAAVVLWNLWVPAHNKLVDDDDAADYRDLEPRLDLLPVAFLLASAALETALKAVIVARDPGIVDRKGTAFYSHNLPWLAEAARLDLSESRREVLGRLREIIEHRAKYPIPKWNKPLEEAIKAVGSGWIYTDFYALVEMLKEAITTLYELTGFDWINRYPKKAAWAQEDTFGNPIKDAG